MSSTTRSDASGFSLVELTVALVVTLIVTGAIYGLLAGGQSAFRREPELADRQQNARVAMDLIMKDIANAGVGMPPFVQVFTPGLNACTSCPNGGAPMGLGGNVTDELEMLTNDSSRDNEPVCDTPGTANAANIRLVRNPPPLSGPILIIFGDGTWTMRYITSTTTNSTGAQNCQPSTSHTELIFNSGALDPTAMNTAGGSCKPSALGVGNAGNTLVGGSSVNGCPWDLGYPLPYPPPPGTACCTATTVSFTQLVRYRIRYNAAGVPELQRSDSTNFTAGFQTVARGIEDLQVQYTQANGTVTPAAPGAPAVTANNYGTLITQVQVTLSSRSEAKNVQGASTDPNLGTAVRGSLSWSGTPRTALYALTQQSPAPVSPAPWLWR